MSGKKRTRVSDLDGPANSNNAPTEEIKNSPTVSAVDEIFYNLFETKAHRNRKHKTQTFYGIVLDRDEITQSDCILETSKAFYSTIDSEYVPPLDDPYVSSFARSKLLEERGIAEYAKFIGEQLEKKVKQLKGEEEEDSGKKVYRVKVYIPEIMGFLPMLTKQEVQQYQSFKKSGKKLNKKEIALKENFRERLSRITSFYGKGDSLPPILQKVKVEFNDMNNMFFGKFLEVV